MQNIKITPEDYIAQEFAGCSKPPTRQTVRNWIRRKVLPGEKIGGRWFVFVQDKTPASTGNEELDAILKKIS